MELALGGSALEREVDRNINDIFKEKPDLARFFRQHGRKTLFLQNLAKELARADNKRVLKTGPETLAYSIREMTKLYCKLVLEHTEQQNLSSLERHRRIAEADRIKEAEGIVKEALPNLEVDDFKTKEL